ncbi:MAG: hypothetical protein ACREJV_08415 [Candidatus Rokuibacteriota bacterium]
MARLISTTVLLRGLAGTRDGKPSFPDYERIPTSASLVIVPGLPLPSDIVRALELDARFVKLNLGLVDGTVVAVAERRHVYRVLTTDRRDFAAIRIGPRLSRALALLP